MPEGGGALQVQHVGIAGQLGDRDRDRDRDRDPVQGGRAVDGVGNISDRSRTGRRTTLPIGSRPAIDLIVDECRAAGVDQIAVAVRAGSSQVQDLLRTKSRLGVTPGS
jgi:hypothetical protein